MDTIHWMGARSSSEIIEQSFRTWLREFQEFFTEKFFSAKLFAFKEGDEFNELIYKL